MEVYYCLGCFVKITRERPQQGCCPKCRHHYVYWHTYAMQHGPQLDLPAELVKIIENDEARDARVS